MMVRPVEMAERPVPAFDRREPLWSNESAGKPRCGEVAGTTAAACAAVCCCCPCGLAGLLVLAVVKVPAGLCRKAIRRKKRKKKKSSLLKRSNTELPQIHPLNPSAALTEEDFAKLSQVGGASPFEDEILMNFHTGFWRNPSIG